MTGTPQWLVWARELQAIAQTGLSYSENDHDRTHYTRVREIAAEIVASQANIPTEKVLEDFELQLGYATPKVDVRAAAFYQGRVLMVKDRIDGKWSLPGGWAEVGSAPSQTAAREVYEESGLEVVPCRVVGVYDTQRTDEDAAEFYHAYKIVFMCDIVGGIPSSSDETGAVSFFDLNDLPPLSESRTNMRQLQDAWAHSKDPQASAAFD